MKRYVTVRKIIWSVISVITLLVLGLMGHWFFGTGTAIAMLATVWIPDNALTIWIKALLVTFATLFVGMTITQTEPIYSALSDNFPAGLYVIPMTVCLIALCIGAAIAWRRREDFLYGGRFSFVPGYDEEDDDDEFEEEYNAKVIDLRKVFCREEKEIHVWADESSHTAIVTFGENRWLLKKGEAKLLEHTDQKTTVELMDGTRLMIPHSHLLETTLA